MPSILNATTTSGLVTSADNSGSLELQANGSTKLTVGSTGVNIGQYNPSASLITSGTAVASTSGTSIDFTSIPSWVKRITVMFNNVSLNGSANIFVQIGTSGGIQTTGYAGTAVAFASASLGVSSSITTAYALLTNNAGSIYSGSATICLLDSASGIWCFNGALSSSTDQRATFGTGAKTLSGTLDRVRITTSNGTDTFDAGSINILYE